MTYKNIFIILISLIVVSLIGVMSYFYFPKITAKDRISSSGKEEVSDKIFDVKTVATGNEFPFYIENSSAEYSSLLNDAKDIRATYEQVGDVDTKTSEKFFSEALAFAADTNKDKKERAYATNLLTSVYLRRQDTKAFYNAISIYPEYKNEYQKQINFLKAQKPKQDVKTPSIMKSYVNMYDNYATQKTLAMINKEGFEIYPNSYSLLRYGLNTTQSDSLVLRNFDMTKSYKNFKEFMLKNYLSMYFPLMEENLKKFNDDGTYYKDLYSSSYEADIMTIHAYLWQKYDLASTKEEREVILRKIIDHTEHMVQSSNQYNSSRISHIGYSISAMNKLRVADKKVLSTEERTKLKQEAETLFRSLLFGTQSKQFKNWMKELPREGEIYSTLKKLGSKDEIIKNFFTQLEAESK